MGAVQHPECERARLWVSLALDGELSEIEQVSLRAHVGRCEECAAFEHDVDALSVELRSAPLERPAFPVAQQRRRRTAMRVLQIAAAAAAIVLAAGLGSLAGSLSSGGTLTATTVVRTAGESLGARLDRRIVAMAPVQQLPAARIRPSVAI
jgi:predicted anti-sigma-YlaC factor YlaD